MWGYDSCGKVICMGDVQGPAKVNSVKTMHAGIMDEGFTVMVCNVVTVISALHW
jgi:BRCT domain type II-containing protein